jgi:hypothetical protein
MAQTTMVLFAIVAALASAPTVVRQDAPRPSVRGAFPAISTGCTACHRAFAREATVIKP